MTGSTWTQAGRESSFQPLVALDIETTGLDPVQHSVVAAALTTEGAETLVNTDEREIELLNWLEERVRSISELCAVLVTWNGEEFDLPFLRRRFEENGIETDLKLGHTAGMGKYGKPRFNARWGQVRHIDVAYLLRETSEERGVPWSLKPLASDLLDVVPVVVERDGASISSMDKGDLRRYVASDSAITLALAQWSRDSGLVSSEPTGWATPAS